MFEELGKTLNEVNGGYQTSGITTIEGLLGIVANVVIGVAMSISFITLAYSFIQLLNSKGDPKLAGKAMNATLWSCVAFLISLMVYILRDIFWKLF